MYYKKLFLLFFSLIQNIYISTYNFSEIFAPQTYSAKTLQYFLQNYYINVFVDHCNDLPLEEIKDLIKTTVAQHSEQKIILFLLENLENEIQKQIKKINLQIKYKYTFDHDIAKATLIMSLIALVSYKLTCYFYKKQKTAESWAHDNLLKKSLWQKGIHEKKEHFFGYTKTTFTGRYSGSQEDFIKECKEYLAAEKEYERIINPFPITELFGITALLSSAIGLSCFFVTLVHNPNGHNKDLPMYKELLEFIVQLKKEHYA